MSTCVYIIVGPTFFWTKRAIYQFDNYVYFFIFFLFFDSIATRKLTPNTDTGNGFR